MERADFKSLGDVIELSDSSLSKNLAILEEAGLVDVEKGRINRKPRTWVRLTPAGREAFDVQLQALHAMVDLKLPAGA